VANTITVTYKVNEDGSLTKIEKSAKGAAKATDKAAKSSDNYSKKQKGVAGATSNSTKAFSKMTSGISGGLVPAYAALAANVFAVSAAFNFFKRAADVKILEEGQASYAASTGIALQTITSNLRDASNGMLGFREAAEAAAIGVAKGFSPDQLNKLAEGAKKAAAALGRNFEDAFDRLIRGASKAEPELLDELGITLRLETATRRYADSIGVAADDLNTFQKSQAVLIETQRQLDAQFGQMEGATNPFVKLAKTFEDIIKAGTQFLMPLFQGIANIVNRSAVAAIAVFGMFGISILKVMFPMEGLSDRIKQIGIDSAASVQAAKDDQVNYRSEIEKTNAALEAGKKKGVQTASQGLGQSSSKLIQKAQKGELTDPKQIGSLKAHLKKAEVQFKIYGEVRKGIFKGADMAQMQGLKAALNHMGKDSMTFTQRRKLQLKSLTLATKVHYAKVRALGSAAFVKLGKVATTTGKVMGKAMKLAGFIGMAMMIFEIFKTLGTKIGGIMKSITKGLDFVINGFLGGIDVLLTQYGKMFDSVFNTVKKGINILIKGYNLLPGVDDIKLLKTNTTAAEDALGGLIGRVNLSSEDSFLNSAAMSIQNFTVNTITAKEEMDALSDKIKNIGADLKNATKGNDDFLKGNAAAIERALKRGAINAEEAAEMATAAIAKVEGNRATSMSTLGIGGLMRDIEGTEDAGKRVKLQEKLNALLPKARKLNLEYAEAIKSGNISVVEGIEATAREAGAGLASLNNGILDLSSAMGSKDLLKAEIILTNLKDTAELTSANFKELFGEDSKAATAALAKYQTAFTKAGTTTEEFRQVLIKLRQDMDEFAVRKLGERFLKGFAASSVKLRNTLTGINLDIRNLQAEHTTADASRKLAIEAEIKLLQKKAGIVATERTSLGTGSFGEGVGASSAIAQTLPAITVDSSAIDTVSQLGQLLAPIADSFASLGPDGKAVQAMMEGMIVMTEGATTLRDTLREITQELGIEMPSSLKDFGEMWNSPDFDMADKAKLLSVAFGAIAGQIGALNSAMQAKSQQVVAGIDKEIAAEKKRDGASAASSAKIKALEAKKEKEKKKAFATDKKMKIAQTVMATAMGIMQAFQMGPILGPIFGAMVAATGAMQLSVIKGMTYEGGGGGGSAGGISAMSVGQKSNTVDLAKGNNQSGELASARGAQGTGQMQNFTPAFTGYKNRAAGGNTGFIVGEQGPELFIPEVPGNIIPAGETAAGSPPTNISFTIQAIDASGVEDMLDAQKGNIIRMIREAANQQGEFFLEAVEETNL
jgi:hypothetical protein